MYERPREKLRYRGAAFLTMSELLQVLIGSGSAGYSAARVARSVEKVLSSPLSYGHLTEIPGLGHAKACQLIAAIEMGRRMLALEEKRKEGGLEGELFNEYLATARSKGRRAITCFWFDGSGQRMDVKVYQMHRHEALSVLARRILADALAASVHGLGIFVPSANILRTPSASELHFTQSLIENSRYFQLHLKEICAFDATAHTSWKRSAYG